MPNPVLAILSSDGRTASALGRKGSGTTAAVAIRDLARSVLVGIDHLSFTWAPGSSSRSTHRLALFARFYRRYASAILRCRRAF